MTSTVPERREAVSGSSAARWLRRATGDAPATVTVQVPAPVAPAPAAPASAAPVAPSIVTLPDVVGQNGAIAQDTLRSLGLTKVEMAPRTAF